MKNRKKTIKIQLKFKKNEFSESTLNKRFRQIVVLEKAYL